MSFYTKQGAPLNRGATEWMLKHVIEIKTDKKEYHFCQECGKLNRMGEYEFRSDDLLPENCELKRLADHLNGKIKM